MMERSVSVITITQFFLTFPANSGMGQSQNSRPTNRFRVSMNTKIPNLVHFRGFDKKLCQIMSQFIQPRTFRGRIFHRGTFCGTDFFLFCGHFAVGRFALVKITCQTVFVLLFLVYLHGQKAAQTHKYFAHFFGSQLIPL